MIITSKQNEIIKYAVKLKETKFIKEAHECIVESEKVVKELIDSASTLLIAEDKKDRFADIITTFTGQIYYISESISSYLSDSTSSSGIFGFVKIAEGKEISGSKAIILDNIQDPANLGAIIRSAVAFGYKDLVLVDGVYPYLPKVIRTSMSYVFKMNIILLKRDELVDFLHKNQYNLVCADMSGEDLKSFKVKNPHMLVIGNEGNGVSDTLKRMSRYIVKIPMENNVESLNAAVSASIIMYKLNLGE